MTPMDGSDLTQRQKAILDFILETVEGRGYPPAVREIGEAVGLNSPSTVHAHLQTLEERGYLRRDPTKPRAIEVRWNRDAGLVEERPSVRNLPIYGQIAAGPTSLAEQMHEGILPFPNEFVDETPHFVLKIKGESMIDAGILDGDLAVIRVQPDASNGDIVAAQTIGPTGEAEATIKSLKRNNGRVFLVPHNPAMEPIQAPDDVRILGKVVAILRRL
jgi:repressor LexA